MSWAKIVARRGDRRIDKEFRGGGGVLKERDQLEDIGVETRIILKLIFNKW
jgi:hypothetical protein